MHRPLIFPFFSPHNKLSHYKFQWVAFFFSNFHFQHTSFIKSFCQKTIFLGQVFGFFCDYLHTKKMLLRGWYICAIFFFFFGFGFGFASNRLHHRCHGARGTYPTILVDQSGRGNFTTIQSAIDSIPSNNQNWICVYITAGEYRYFFFHSYRFWTILYMVFNDKLLCECCEKIAL